MSDAKTASSSAWGKDRLACSFAKVTQLRGRADSAGSKTFPYPRHGTTCSGTYDLKITSNVQRIPCQRSAAKLFMAKFFLILQKLRMNANVQSKRGTECGCRRGSRTFQNETTTNNVQHQTLNCIVLLPCSHGCCAPVATVLCPYSRTSVILNMRTDLISPFTQ